MGLRSHCPMGTIIPIPGYFGHFCSQNCALWGGRRAVRGSAEKQEASCDRNADLWLAPGDDPTRRTSPSGSRRRRPPGVGTPRCPGRARGKRHSHSQSSAAAAWQLCPGSWRLASSPFRCAARRETEKMSQEWFNSVKWLLNAPPQNSAGIQRNLMPSESWGIVASKGCKQPGM